VLGAVDGCHIGIKAPQERHIDYLNRKMYHSLVLQGISNARRIFNVYVGCPGSMHDARVLQNSNIFLHAENGTLVPADKHIIGDSAYPLKTWLLAPYRDTGKLTHTERRFNKRLSQTRVSIEHTFGLLKNRFRRLLHTVDASPEFASKIVVAACVLHNVCQDDTADVSDFEENGSMADSYVCTVTDSSDADEPAKLKRKRIAESFML